MFLQEEKGARSLYLAIHDEQGMNNEGNGGDEDDVVSFEEEKVACTGS